MNEDDGRRRHEPTVAAPLLAWVVGLVAELRAVGVAVTPGEVVDAADAMRHVDLADRVAVHTALGCAIVKRADHQSTFDRIFEIYADAGAIHAGTAVPGLASLDDDKLRRVLARAIADGAAPLIRGLAAIAVDRYAGYEPGRPSTGAFYLVKTMRAIGRERLLDEVEAAASSPAQSSLEQRVAVKLGRERVEDFQRDVEAEIRHRLVGDSGAGTVARSLRRPLPEDVDFLDATQAQLAELDRATPALAQAIMGAVVRHRRVSGRGRFDFRRSVRQAMSTGGEAILPKLRPPRPARLEIFVLADVSGSVSTFAAFTFQLIVGMQATFPRVRGFVFADGITEITAQLAGARRITELTKHVNASGAGVWLDGHSDYGQAFESFWAGYGSQVNGRTVVLVLGDARTNYHAPRAEVVRALGERSARLYWLNPEPATTWDTGDSVMSSYARYCDGVFECRNVRQLQAFAEHLAMRPG